MSDYACIQMDPPWPETGGGGRGAQDHYDVADRSSILRAIVSAPEWRPARNTHLWCWTTMSSLPDGLWLVDALGFRYVTHAVWVKVSGTRTLDGSLSPQLGIGQYLRGAHELLLLGVRGDGYAVRTAARNIPSWFAAPVPRGDDGQRIHSRKPERAYEIIETRSHGPRLEMFARVARKGWQSWGSEAPDTLKHNDHDTAMQPVQERNAGDGGILSPGEDLQEWRVEGLPAVSREIPPSMEGGQS